MVRGTVGVIACPMLEDELIFSLTSDPDRKKIYLVEEEAAVSIAGKFRRYGIPFIPIDPYQFEMSVDNLNDDCLNFVIRMNTLGLHEDPRVLKEKIEEQVIMSQGRFDVLMLYYGLCGNHGWDISKWAEGRGYRPVTVFRDGCGRVCDDCIGVAVGGTDRYLKLMKNYTGMLYLTPCMATNWTRFVGSMAMFRGIDRDDRGMMKQILEICGYEYAVRIDTGLGDPEEFEECAQILCREMNLKLISAEDGWATLEPAKRLYAETKNILADLE